MSWRTSGWAISARNIGRALGVNRLLARFILGSEYEANYDKEFAKQIVSGDRVWDVGANVGYYTNLFADRVGPEGLVFAFEPSPHNFPRLEAACAERTNVQLFNMGLGDEDATLGFEQGADDLGATSRVVEPSEATISVAVRSGTNVLGERLAEAPNIVKIDVEGFEHEVIMGLGDRVRDPSLRAIGIEMHFRILQERGLAHAPSAIEGHLKEAGFDVVWADPSHLLAVRPQHAVDQD
jgi:FkbM family methyltransferase